MLTSTKEIIILDCSDISQFCIEYELRGVCTLTCRKCGFTVPLKDLSEAYYHKCNTAYAYNELLEDDLAQ